MKTLQEILDSPQPKAKEGCEWVDDAEKEIRHNPNLKMTSADFAEWENSAAGIDY